MKRSASCLTRWHMMAVELGPVDRLVYEYRPHFGLTGRMSSEVYFGRFTAHRRPGIESAACRLIGAARFDISDTAETDSAAATLVRIKPLPTSHTRSFAARSRRTKTIQLGGQAAGTCVVGFEGRFIALASAFRSA
jgi:hypothetical protein